MANEYSGIALQANKHKKVQTLMHYVNERNLEQEHKLQKSGKATGADGMNKEKYDASLKENIDNLLSRMKRFSYRPQAVKRAYIPKVGSNKMRPLGIPAYEDTVKADMFTPASPNIFATSVKRPFLFSRKIDNCLINMGG